MLIGDAARHTEPITGGGILTAIGGGTIAGEVAQKAVHQNDSSVRVFREYETRWHNSFGRIHKGMYKMKEFMVKLSDDELNRMSRVFQGMMPEELSIRGVTMRLLKKDPTLLLTIRHLLF